MVQPNQITVLSMAAAIALVNVGKVTLYTNRDALREERCDIPRHTSYRHLVGTRGTIDCT